MMKFSFITSLIFFVVLSSRGADWPTYGGPDRNHQSQEKTLRLDWGNEEPQILWKLEVGLGYSSVVEANGLAYTQGYKDDQNTLYCVQSQNGKVLWTHTYKSGLGDKYFQGGTRSTPTIFKGKVYLQGHEGPLFCLDAKTGKIIWQRHLVDEFDGNCPTWGYSGSPLVVGNKVIVQTGSADGSLVALNVTNGKEIWRGGAAEAGYASPYLRANNPSEIVVFNQHGLSLHDLQTGKEKVSYQHKTRYEVNAAQPMDLGDQVLVASGYGKGAALLDLKSFQPKELWESDGVACQMASLVHLNGFAYGIHGQTGANARRATLFCLELKDGRKIWEERGFGVGTVILIDMTLAVLSDRGELALVKASPDGFKELVRFHVLGGKNNWTPLTYTNGRMHCRSSSGSWVCLAMGK
jgi:outer membrane protein assembly factor BamB